MPRSALVISLLSFISVLPAYGQATQYTIAFKATAGSPVPTGSFIYNPSVLPAPFSNFLVVWDGVTFDFTSIANNPGAAQIFNHPACADGLSGGAATFYLLTECPQAVWGGSSTPTSSSFSFGESDTGGANLFDLGVTVIASPPASTASADGTFASSVFPGVIYIADSQNNRIRRVDASGIITTVAGNGTGWFGGDGGPATSAELRNPYGVAVDTLGNLYIADTQNNRIRMVTIATGVIATVAGNGAPSYSGDGGPAVSAGLNNPTGVAVDGSGNIFIADQQNNRIRKVSGGTITTVAGNGTVGNFGDGGPATSAELYYPTGITADTSGDLFIADSDNQRIREVSAGTISTVAGSGAVGYSCNNGAATSVGLHTPTGVALDSLDNLYIADSANQCIRKDPAAALTTVAGNGTSSYGGDGGSATGAELNYPTGIALDSVNNLFIADDDNHRVRIVGSGTINTLAGNGHAGYNGDGIAATTAELYNPTGVAAYTAPGCQLPFIPAYYQQVPDILTFSASPPFPTGAFLIVELSGIPSPTPYPATVLGKAGTILKISTIPPILYGAVCVKQIGGGS